MADPVSGGIGKASQQMMKELQKQASEAGGKDQQQNQVGKRDFAQHMDVSKAQDPSKVNDVTKTQDVQKTMKAQEVQNAQNANLQTKPVEEVKSTKNAGFHRLMDDIVGSQNKLDDIIKLSLSGKQFNQKELLAIQASVYKFSQELDLTSKVVEKATSGIKQTMQTQV